MKKLKTLKLMIMALYLGIPISSVFVNSPQEANAAIKIGSAINKLSTSVKPTLIKPPLAPKPTNIPKIPANMANKINKTHTSSSALTNAKYSFNHRVKFFNNMESSTPKPQGPITQKVNKLNLSAKLPNSNGLNSSSGSLKQENSKQKTQVSRKLSLDSGFKNKLDSIFSEGKPDNKKQNPKPQTNTPNKLSSDSIKNLEGILGGGNKNQTSTTTPNSTVATQDVFVNNSAPPPPPLPSSDKILSPINKTNPNIPPAPPLPEQKPVISTGTGSGGSTLQNQLNSKLSSGLNKIETNSAKKTLSKVNSNPTQDSLIAELQSKLNSKK